MKNILALFTNNYLITEVLAEIPHVHLYSAHDTLYIYKYRNESIRKLIIAAKNNTYDALTMIARVIHAGICTHMQQESTYVPGSAILVLHTPSSSFALAKKQVDHMAIALNLLLDIHSTHQKIYRGSPFAKAKIDIAPYVFMHSKPPLVSQHHKNRLHRLEDMQNRFYFANYIPDHLLSQYRYIYIVDDVLTTGSTLQSLKQILSVYCSKHHLNPAIYTLAICH